jgi:hypothetical protein
MILENDERSFEMIGWSLEYFRYTIIGYTINPPPPRGVSTLDYSRNAVVEYKLLTSIKKIASLRSIIC